MSESSNSIVDTLIALPIFQAEWVLWLLLGLSVLSMGVMVERVLFYRRHRIDFDDVHARFRAHLRKGELAEAVGFLGKYDSLETNVVLYGLRDAADGPEAVEDLLAAAARNEKARYEKWLSILATIASNAPFIGLFGTVLGIVRAFKDLSGDIANASNAVMAGIAEALIATAIGLMVAIPAVVAFNVLKGRVKATVDNMHLMAGTLLARLKADAARSEEMGV
jgi:biopolymer transport protein ExbB/TolQ